MSCTSDYSSCNVSRICTKFKCILCTHILYWEQILLSLLEWIC